MIPWLSADQPPNFPRQPPDNPEYPGLIAAGGSLTPEWLEAAYNQGIFPWYNRAEPILWWSPDPRAVLFPEEIRLHKRFLRWLKGCNWRISTDQAFEAVIQGCAAPRKQQQDTWLNPAMQKAYTQLHRLGKAHSFEVWNENELIGGLYGPCRGQVFFAESMYSKASNASKVALLAACYHLLHCGFRLIDCQIMNPHLESLGARHIHREQFLRLIRTPRHRPRPQEWRFSIRAYQLLEKLPLQVGTAN